MVLLAFHLACKRQVWPSSHLTEDTLALGRAVGCVRAFILGQSLMDMFAPADQAPAQGPRAFEA